MENRIILNSDNFKELQENNLISFFKKNAKNNYTNYFILPNIAIELYSAQVSWVDNYGKNLSLKYNKYDYLSLKNFLIFISDTLMEQFIKKTGQKINTNASLIYEKDDYFYIKCFLPTFSKKFPRPVVGAIYQTATIDIRNIWYLEDPLKYGFNLELKHVAF